MVVSNVRYDRAALARLLLLARVDPVPDLSFSCVWGMRRRLAPEASLGGIGRAATLLGMISEEERIGRVMAARSAPVPQVRSAADDALMCGLVVQALARREGCSVRELGARFPVYRLRDARAFAGG